MTKIRTLLAVIALGLGLSATLLPTAGARTVLRIGVYSGTFDPPHEGHRKVIDAAVRSLGLDEIVVIPNYQPALKPNATSFEDRLAMTRLALAGVAHVRIATAEEAKHAREIGLANVLAELGQVKPGASLYHIMGDDSFERLAARAPIEFPERVTIAVSIRDQAGKEMPKSFAGRPVVILKPGEEDLSSSLLRKLYGQHEGVALRRLVAPVQDYVYARHLYGARLSCARVFVPYDE